MVATVRVSEHANGLRCPSFGLAQNRRGDYVLFELQELSPFKALWSAQVTGSIGP